MIPLLTKKIRFTKSFEEFRISLEEKTLKKNYSVDIYSTLNMIDNHKDFYGYYKGNSLVISRIRRLSFLRLLPKLIVVFPDSNTLNTYKIKMGTFTSIGVIFLGLMFLSNIYRFFSTGSSTTDLQSILIFAGFVGLLMIIEVNIYIKKIRKLGSE